MKTPVMMTSLKRKRRENTRRSTKNERVENTKRNLKRRRRNTRKVDPNPVKKKLRKKISLRKQQIQKRYGI